MKTHRPESIASSTAAVMSGDRVMASLVANRVLDLLPRTTSPQELTTG